MISNSMGMTTIASPPVFLSKHPTKFIDHQLPATSWAFQVATFPNSRGPLKHLPLRRRPSSSLVLGESFCRKKYSST